MFKNKKYKEHFILVLLLFSLVITVLPTSVSADEPTIDPYIAPGAPDGISMDELFKIGILNDMTHYSGQHTWNGAVLAALEINEAGGLFINSNHYYIGLVAENTFEAEATLDITKGVNAANKMISEYDPHVIMGGFRTEALSEYLEPIMDAQIPFICTGSSSDIFSQNVLNNYNRYKYFFRTMLNSTKIGGDLINYIPYLANELSTISGKEVKKVAILREDLPWSVPLAVALDNFLPFFGLEVVEDIALSVFSSEQDFKNAWHQIDLSGAQIVIPIFSSGQGISMGRTYGEVKPRVALCGINVLAQSESYWDDTYGNCNYEITYQGLYRTEKTPKTIPFWDNYVANYSIEPLYTAATSYDAIYVVSNATLSTQSFWADDIVFGLEQINQTNTFTGVGGNIAFISSHDLLGGFHYSTSLFCQWQMGTKVVLPSGNTLYPDSFATGSLTIPDWGINPRELIYGVALGPDHLEPLNAWESNSVEVIEQVVESLFAYNLSDPNMGLVPSLASDFGTWSLDNLNYTVSLKNDVFFHDGTPFTASSVDWNFNRIAYFMNISGTLPEYEQTPVIESLFRWPDWTPIINHTEVMDIYEIRFVLNRPFGAFEALLSFWGTGILSPASTPEMEYIDLLTGDLIGTGPYEYIEYIDDIEVNLQASESYRDGVADLKLLKFLIIPDNVERNEALLSGDIDFLGGVITSMIDSFEEDPFISVVRGQNAIVHYISMNNKFINKTMRQAISHAIDYSYIIDILLDGEATRLRSPIPEVILYANWSFDVATFNITKARQILVLNGVCNFDIYEDSEWLYAATNNPIAIYNYTYILGSAFREDLGILLQDNLEAIGIKVELKGLSIDDFLDRYYWDHDKLELCYIGWLGDYNDPSNYICPLFSNRSSSNIGRVNDPVLENLIEQGLTEVDPVAREAIYDEMQQYIVEDLMPYAFVAGGTFYDVYRSEFIDYPSNPLGKVWFYPVKLQDITPPETFINLIGEQSSYGWFESEVSVSFSAIDYFSGVYTTEYSFDGENWITYTEPISISEEGMTVIFYKSIDLKGNVEDTKFAKICIYSYFSERDLVFGTTYGISDLDPLNAWDTDSFNVLEQVIEGLFAYNLSHPEEEIIPRLATDFGTWSVSKLEYTVNIRDDVLFHDGNELNAFAVEWNFNRLAYFMNISGTLPWNQHIAYIDSMYRWIDGTPIINSVEAIGPYTVKFILNRPYAAFEALLTFPASYILSPSSTPESNYLFLPDGTGIMTPIYWGPVDIPSYWYPIGTGPFMLDFYIQDMVVKFSPFESYWQGRPKIESLIYLIIHDSQSRNDALLSGEVDFILNPMYSMFDDFNADPSITLHDAGNTALIRYIGMNNNQINKTIRQAISYAINYSYIIDVLLEGQGIRIKSPVPKGVLYANWSFNVATMNVTKAREILLDAGVVSGLDPLIDADWTYLVDYGTPIATYNYSYNFGNYFREGLLILLQENLRQIGIQVLDAGLEWEEYLNRLFNRDNYNRDMLQLFDLGWLPDINDPSNFLDSQFSSDAYYNLAQVNDPYLQDRLTEGLEEYDHNTRRTIYNEIQKYLVEELMPWAYMFAGLNFYVYNDEFTGYEPNTMQILWFYSISRVLPSCNETAEWGVNTGEQLIWNASGYLLEYMPQIFQQESPVQWMMDIQEINLTNWKDLPYDVPYDYYSTIWATMYNRSTDEDPWDLMLPFAPLIFYNACEQLIYNQLFANIMQNYIHLLIPTPVNLEILNNTLCNLWGYYAAIIETTIYDNSFEIIIDAGIDIFTFNYTYNHQGILTLLTLVNSTGHFWLDIEYQAPDNTPPIWIELPTDQIVELGSRFLYQVWAFDESGVDHYWISDVEYFEINNSGVIVDKDFLELGVYELEVRAYDPYDNFCSATFFVNVIDSISPFGIDSIYDTIPNATVITYTRTSQIIGSVKVFDNSEIANVELWNNDPVYGEYIPEGFSIVTTNYPKTQFGVYAYRYRSDITIMTTSFLKEGDYSLNLRVYDSQGNVANKYFNITVFRQLELKLSGEFDFLEKEKVKISIAAYLIDVETGDPVIPTDTLNFTINLIFVSPTGDILATVEMEHMGLGVYRYVSEWTIDQMKNVFKKGIYLVYGYIDFDSDEHYYSVREDLLQFHIDPPNDQEINPWLYFSIISCGGVLLFSIVAIFYSVKKNRKKSIE